MKNISYLLSLLLVFSYVSFADDESMEAPKDSEKVVEDVAEDAVDKETEEDKDPTISEFIEEGKFEVIEGMLDIYYETEEDTYYTILEEENLVDPATYTNNLLEHLSAKWEKSQPAQFITIAGSTGSMPATAELIKVVASLKNGAVVLPGLDRREDEIYRKRELKRQIIEFFCVLMLILLIGGFIFFIGYLAYRFNGEKFCRKMVIRIWRRYFIKNSSSWSGL